MHQTQGIQFLYIYIFYGTNMKYNFPQENLDAIFFHDDQYNLLFFANEKKDFTHSENNFSLRHSYLRLFCLSRRESRFISYHMCISEQINNNQQMIESMYQKEFPKVKYFLEIFKKGYNNLQIKEQDLDLLFTQRQTMRYITYICN